MPVKTGVGFGLPTPLTLVMLSSTPSGIEVEFQTVSADHRPESLANIREFAKSTQHVGPSPRLDLPGSHPESVAIDDPNEAALTFVNMFVVKLDPGYLVECDYGRYSADDSGSSWPLQSWSNFMKVLLDAIEAETI